MKTEEEVDKLRANRPDSFVLDKIIEIYSISYKGIWYEVRVDATEQRKIEGDIFAEYGKVTAEVNKHIENLIKNIDN